jgi:predicted N-formylglutamate amidohydrolase
VKPALVFTCEHGGNRVPARYQEHFEGAARAVASHRGWDRGALPLARELARAFAAPLFACTTTRLLVDPNRSVGHPGLFSEWTRDLSRAEREAILARWWAPHREDVERTVRSRARGRRPVLHLSVHSFTPRWKGRARTVDVSLLYDPSRAPERAFAGAWLGALGTRRPELRLRRNQPYRGTADGLTSYLRTRFPEERYLGIELEVSQRFPLASSSSWRRLRRDLVETLREVT